MTESGGHAADRLLAAVKRVGSPVCVGIDPVVERLPEILRPAAPDAASAAAAITTFGRGVLQAVTGRVGCVKFQSACFERYGHRGVQGLEHLIGEARRHELQVILDAKRGDIGISAGHYAAAAFDGEAACTPDWITINSYLGADGITPFLRPGVGAFALVRTSNDSGDAVQAARLQDGRTVAELVAQTIAAIGDASIGRCGYSALGAVVGATKASEAAALRALMPRQIFLVPGFGAQGAGPDDIRPCFAADGRGAIVTASRSVIYAFDPGDQDWSSAVADAAETLARQVAGAVPVS